MTEGHEREETIVPVERPFGGFEPGRPAPRPTKPHFPLVWVAGVLLLVTAAAVFFALPRWVERREQPVDSAPVVATVHEAPSEPVRSPEELAALEDDAEKLLADLLEQQDALEARSASSWGEQSWLDYEEQSRQGDDALLAKDFDTAIERYTRAHEIGDALMSRSGEITKAALSAGHEAILAGNPELASQQFDIVLSVDPENAEAAAGKARAERLPEVLEHVRKGEELRQAQSLEEAAGEYRAALAIDPDWSPAKSALADVTKRLADARFEQLLSQGFAAIGEKEYDDAEEAFREALKLRPGYQAAVDGLEQAEQGQKLDAIALAEIRALAFERRELWDQAIARYEAALDTDPTLAFAISGLERSRSRADLDRKLENLIANPDLLLTDSVLEDARKLLEQARPWTGSGERIAGQVAKLERLVELASTPISVELRSDAMTEVTVYRVGQLGSFEHMEVELRPGTYTAVGSRRGYRDVRTTFTVLPGREPPAVDIVCVEPI